MGAQNSVPSAAIKMQQTLAAMLIFIKFAGIFFLINLAGHVKIH